jgi:hypothetical protein
VARRTFGSFELAWGPALLIAGLQGFWRTPASCSRCNKLEIII